jgi:hypothetical protein
LTLVERIGYRFKSNFDSVVLVEARNSAMNGSPLERSGKKWE